MILIKCKHCNKDISFNKLFYSHGLRGLVQLGGKCSCSKDIQFFNKVEGLQIPVRKSKKLLKEEMSKMQQTFI